MEVRILYRLIQEIPVELWAKKLEMERKCDEIEAKNGHPLPRRYRAFFGSEKSHIRVNEREYASFADFAARFEEFYENEELMQLEAERRKYIKWEREELYYVDSDQPEPMWMSLTAKEFNKQGKEG